MIIKLHILETRKLMETNICYLKAQQITQI